MTEREREKFEKYLRLYTRYRVLAGFSTIFLIFVIFVIFSIVESYEVGDGFFVVFLRTCIPLLISAYFVKISFARVSYYKKLIENLKKERLHG